MTLSEKLLFEGKGVLRLAPTWVPRSFCRPGKRIKLHPDDYYVLGLERGGIDERWLASTTWAENGPSTPDDEGLSYIVSADGSERILLRDAVEELKGEIIGDELWNKYHKWPMFSKFFRQPRASSAPYSSSRRACRPCRLRRKAGNVLLSLTAEQPRRRISVYLFRS